VAGSFEQGNEPMGSVNHGNISTESASISFSGRALLQIAL